MPESPEVQVLAEALDARLAGRRIAEIDVIEFRAAKTPVASLGSLSGRRIRGVSRWGKHLDLAVDDLHLVISLGRRGWIRLREEGAAEAESPPALVRLTLDDGAAASLTDAGDWLSAGVSLVAEPREVAALAKLGPDPLDPAYDDATLRRALDRRKQIRALLLEQETVAGIGGAYSDEILHAARISPLVHASDLDDDARGRLLEAIPAVLRGATTARRGVPIDRLKAVKAAAMAVHGRAGRPCPDCGASVADVPGAKGMAQYCPACQGVASG